jgi:hypothetical protein
MPSLGEAGAVGNLFEKGDYCLPCWMKLLVAVVALCAASKERSPCGGRADVKELADPSNPIHSPVIQSVAFTRYDEGHRDRGSLQVCAGSISFDV